jgi:excisionase family DNA binding protein
MNPTIRYVHWPQQPLLKTGEVAQILHVSSRMVCLWAECGEIPAIRVGKQWRFRQQDLTKWLDYREGSFEVPAKIPPPSATVNPKRGI